MKLDKSKPYGTIYGDLDGRAFVQDGRYFNAAGELIGGEKRGKAKSVVEAADEAGVSSAVSDQVQAQLGG